MLSFLSGRNREVYMAVMLAVAVVVVSYLFSRFPKMRRDALEGKEAPNLEFVDKNNRRTQISDQKGAVLLINFWAIWCEPCMEEMPALRALEDHFGSRGFTLLAFNVGEGGKEIRGKLRGGKYPRNLIFSFSKEKLGAYNIEGLPTSILIDKFGTVREVFHGPRNWMDLDIIRKIEELSKASSR